MENGNEQEVLRRRRKVPFSKEETLLILRAYELHPSNWNDVISDIKENVERLSNTHQLLYRSGTTRQLKDRVSSKFGRLLCCNVETITDDDIRAQVQRIKDMVRRLVARPVPDQDNNQRVNMRERIIQQLSDSEDDQVPAANNNLPDPPVGEADANRRDPPQGQVNPENQPQRPAQAPADQQDRPARRRRRNRRSLSDLVRENQILYRRFLTKKVPKILRELGVSSDTSDEEYI